MRRPGESEFSTFLDLDGIASYPNELIVGQATEFSSQTAAFRSVSILTSQGDLLLWKQTEPQVFSATSCPFQTALLSRPTGER